ncbi:MAG: HupE/UreJ family protein [Paenacidovorax caeni]
MNTVATKGLLTIALCALGGAAQAHVGHEGGHAATFVSGLAHPVSGLDHLLAMVAVGLWSAVALPQLLLAGARGVRGRHGIGAFAGAIWVLRCPGRGAGSADCCQRGAAGRVAGQWCGSARRAGLSWWGVRPVAWHGPRAGNGCGSFLPGLWRGLNLATAALHFGGMGLACCCSVVRLYRHGAAGALIGGAGLALLLAWAFERPGGACPTSRRRA